MVNKTESSEELYIKYYLDNIRLKNQQQFRVENLVGDKRLFRRVDFYLPQLDVYVEHFGLYNSTKEIRNEYDEKAKVYFRNNMATVIIYPHELGFLDYAFHTKMLRVLRMPKFNNNFRLLKYKISRYIAKGKGYLFFLSIFFLVLSLGFLFEEDGSERSVHFLLYVSTFTISTFFMLRFFQNFISFFFYDK